MTFRYDGLEVLQIKEEIDELAQLFRGRKILEIGMNEGGLGKYLKQEYNCSMYGIDIVYHAGYDEIYEKYFIGDSLNPDARNFAMGHSPYHVVIIDGNHEDDYPISDFLAYSIYSVEAIVFDDLNYPNVRKWFDQIKTSYRWMEVVKQKTFWNGLGVIYF